MNTSTADIGTGTDLSALQREVRRLKWQLRIALLFVIAAFLVTIWLQRHGVVSQFVYTNELNIPVPSAQSPLVGIARAVDHKSISLWIGSGRFNPASARIDVAETGEASLVFFDTKGKRRIVMGTGADGTPSIQLLDAAGDVTWHAPDTNVHPPRDAKSVVGS